MSRIFAPGRSFSPNEFPVLSALFLSVSRTEPYYCIRSIETSAIVGLGTSVLVLRVLGLALSQRTGSRSLASPVEHFRRGSSMAGKCDRNLGAVAKRNPRCGGQGWGWLIPLGNCLRRTVGMVGRCRVGFAD